MIKKVDGTINDLLKNLQELNEKKIIGYKKNKFFLKTKHKERFKMSFLKELKLFKKIEKKRPPSSLEYFQDPLITEDLFKRIQFIYDRGDLKDKDFFILGDDDLFSIAIALTGLPKRIAVVEIDKRVTKVIRDVARKHNLEIEVIDYNCADPLPAKFRNRFDVFIMDPVETEKGFSAFISRGLQALKHPGAVYFGLTELECPPHIWHKFQKYINRMNLIITDILRKFSFYDEDVEGLSGKRLEAAQKEYDNYKLFKKSPFDLPYPRINWYHSSFVRLETVGSPKPIIKGKIKFDKHFYDNDYILTIP